MNVFGSDPQQRSPDHALIAPDSFVRSPLPGWDEHGGGDPHLAADWGHASRNTSP